MGWEQCWLFPLRGRGAEGADARLWGSPNSEPQQPGGDGSGTSAQCDHRGLCEFRVFELMLRRVWPWAEVRVVELLSGCLHSLLSVLLCGGIWGKAE